MTVFVVVAGCMLVLALAFLLLPLLRSRALVAEPHAARRLKALDDALAAGVIDRDEYKRKRTALSPSVNAPDATHGSPRLVMITTAIVTLLLPAAAIVIYGQVGAPAALDPLRMMATGVSDSAPDGAGGEDMREAIAGLVAKL
ncbi:MAG: c-type cytochrome biogenesis protein CcmI, partial [Dokdonella sp.]